ncbi:uncharacterized protein [Pithys albifrons albifrons]|uniref:uncharacterized protein n=1 Tax=Pithys albifrons albifrons TaxID=3385563 RepID=UPI003A5CAED3
MAGTAGPSAPPRPLRAVRARGRCPVRGSSSRCRSVPVLRADITPGVSIRPREGEAARRGGDGGGRQHLGEAAEQSAAQRSPPRFSPRPSQRGPGPIVRAAQAARSRREEPRPPRPRRDPGLRFELPAGRSAASGRAGPGRAGRAPRTAGRHRPPWPPGPGG